MERACAAVPWKVHFNTHKYTQKLYICCNISEISAPEESMKEEQPYIR